MDMFEKVEKLREKANVSYEEAKAALDETNGDLLDAMILLERAGKAESRKESHTTRAEDDEKYAVVTVNDDTGKDKKKEKNGKGKDFIDKLKVLWTKSCENYFVVEHNDELIIRLPIWLFILILICVWAFTLTILVVGLFLGCRYSFKGKAEMKIANNVMDKASAAADKVKEEFQNLNKNENKNENNNEE